MAAKEIKKLHPVELRNAQITFRNFSGQKKQFNEEGRRNFCVILDNETGEKMAADGTFISTAAGLIWELMP